MELLLLILAIVLIVAGTVRLFYRDFLMGAVLLIVGFLIAPFGANIFS